MSLAYIEAMRGNLDEAEKMYSQIASENENDVEPLKNLIYVLIAEKKYDLAQEKLKLMEEKWTDDEAIPTIKKKIENESNDDEDNKKTTTEIQEQEKSEDLLFSNETE